tara:strand:- start:952 stop:1524 length:573 start_codon:yes stop_codon:yes gene_type:complete
MIERYETMLRQAREFASKNMEDHPYHNFPHAIDVAEIAMKLGEQEGLGEEPIFLLGTAGYLHDTGYIVGRPDNEAQSVIINRPFLVEAGYTVPQIKEVDGMILATKIPTNPQNHMEQIICDADVDNLRREDFFEKGEALSQEFKVTDKNAWNKQSHGFLTTHQYYTQSARTRRGAGFRRNLSKLARMVGL